MLANRPLKHYSLLFILGAIIISILTGHDKLTLLFIGAMFGAVLNYYSFGFRTCSQQLIIKGQTIGIRSVLIMLAVSSLLFFPLLTLGEVGQQTLTGFVQPIGVSVVAGAFFFGFGMQFGNGCTSGTLNKLGQLQLVSFSGFLALLFGGTLAASQIEFWRNLPAFSPYSILEANGLWLGLIIQLSIIYVLYQYAYRKEVQRKGQAQKLLTLQPKHWHPWLKAGVLLALFNALLLATSGQPWSIANIFPFWGLKLGDFIGLPIDWSFWDYGLTHAERLHGKISNDPVSITTIGLILGALYVSLFNFKSFKQTKEAFKKDTQEQLNLTSHLFTLAGGVLMGYGAVIAYGCNIGAFFSGIASGSLHGWLWAFFALFGNILGIFIKNRLTKT